MKYWLVTMSELEVQVGAILENIVNVSVTEMAKMIGVSDSTQLETSSRTTDNPHTSSSETVRKL